MLEHLLVPLDGSRFAEQALPRAVSLATGSGGSIRLVSVSQLPTGRRDAPVGTVPESGDRAGAVTRTERYLDAVASDLRERDAGVEVSTQVLPPGNVVASLRQEMVEQRTDLVVMTTHGRGPLSRAWLGSVADGLVRTSQRPILLIRPADDAEGVADDPASSPASAPFRRVLLPLDGSSVAEQILDHAAALARISNAGIHLVRIVSPVRGGAFPYVAAPAREPEATEDRIQAAGDELEAVAERLRRRDVPAEVEIKVHGQAAAGILEAVRTTEADVVAMSTRGRGGVERLILGSVADKVIRGASVPVLVHRPPVADEG
jgi:nucleotide-binding universal stress UspA family protein